MFGKMEKRREGSGSREIWIEFKKCSCLVGRKRRREGKQERRNTCGPYCFFILPKLEGKLFSSPISVRLPYYPHFKILII